MKACPFCAELIQEAAAKCRFCGEWLDPSKRPAWALGAGSSDPQRSNLPAVHASSPNYVMATPAARTSPSHTTPMGSAPPVGAGVPPASGGLGSGWSRPAWMGSAVPSLERLSPEQTLVEALSPEQVSAALAQAQMQATPASRTSPYPPAASPFDIEQPDPAHAIAAPPPSPSYASSTATTNEGRPLAATPEFASEPRATLEEVAERMQRIKAGAAAVRRAVQHDPSEEIPPRRAVERPRIKDIEEYDQEHDFEHEHRAFEQDFDEPEERPAPRRRPRDTAPRVASRPIQAASPGKKASRPAAIVDADPFHDEDEHQEEDERAFADDFGFDDHDDFAEEGDEEDADDFSDLAPASQRPRMWIPAVAAAAIAAGLGGYFLAPYLVGVARDPAVEAIPEAATDPSGQVRPGSVAPTDDPKASTPAPERPVPESAPATVDDDASDPADASTRSVTQALLQDASRPSKADPETQARLKEARRHFERGVERRGAARLDEAQAILEDILQTQPQLGEALTLMSILHAEKGDWPASRRAATHCTQVAPDEADCWLVLGAVGEEQSHIRDQSDEDRALHRLSAIAAYQQYIELDPKGRFATDATKAIARLK